jgi:hypothetical protein
MAPIEIFRALTPFIILVVTLFIILFLKRRLGSWKTFFELPAAIQVEAIKYLIGYKAEKNAESIISSNKDGWL